MKAPWMAEYTTCESIKKRVKSESKKILNSSIFLQFLA